MRGYAASILLCVLLAAAFGGRIVRATGGEGAAQTGAAAFEADAETLLQARGWSPGERVPITADFTYAARVYRRTECPSLLVSILGAGNDADGLYRRPGSPAWRFIHGGRAYDRPPSLRYTIAHWLSIMKPGATPPAPIVAVASAGNGPLPPPCDGPSPEDWRTMPGAAHAGLRTSAE